MSKMISAVHRDQLFDTSREDLKSRRSRGLIIARAISSGRPIRLRNEEHCSSSAEVIPITGYSSA